ncbi:glycosyltransferase [Agromyces sp. Marseille-P2726]|uniref:glycosyltransferase n=1 Tax=Agromyces sp. Marseille-P2726 TaxID=2709132 RepID=UPI00157088C9|nr:glycosyltransferase [Agromyces sp. Marseille-P2726]
MSEQLVVVSAGSYHLPFDRLGAWMEPWVGAHADVRVIVQHGPGRPVPGAENHDVLPYHELLELCRAADAVVLQGGAGGVMDMRAIGRVPVVVPRVPVHEEVVDEHQLIFTDRAEQLGAVHRATSRERLWGYLDAMLDGRVATHALTPPPTPGIAAATAVLATPPSRLAARARVRRMARSIRVILQQPSRGTQTPPRWGHSVTSSSAVRGSL